MPFPIALLRGLLGIAAIIGLCWLLSENRKRIPWRTVGIGLAMQVVFALLILKTSGGRAVFDTLGRIFDRITSFTTAGSGLLFGPLGTATDPRSLGVIFAFQILPTIIFFGSLMSVLYYLKLMQPIIRGFGWVMARTMRLSGAESVASAANVFVGQTEAPLVVKPYVAGMTRSELFALMVGGMANLAGGVLAAYIGFLGGTDPALRAQIASHLLAASIMSAPASLFLAKMMIPETGTPLTMGQSKLPDEKNADNVLDAAATGASDGLMLALNVGAMLIAFTALVALVNYLLGKVATPSFGGSVPLWDLNGVIRSASGGAFDGLSLKSIFGFALAPIAWLIGVETRDVLLFGSLLGEKTAINEFVAYLSLSNLKAQLTERSYVLATYALSGFANFASIAIQIGGIGPLAPERRGEIASLGLKCVLIGTLCSCLSAAIVGILL